MGYSLLLTQARTILVKQLIQMTGMRKLRGEFGHKLELLVIFSSKALLLKNDVWPFRN